MNNQEQRQPDFTQSSWQQSIAVKIAAQIIWVLVPIVFVSNLYYFSVIEKDESEILSLKVDALNFRISNALTQSLDRENKRALINNIVHELGFEAVEVSEPRLHIVPDIDVSKLESKKRTSILNMPGEIDNPFLSIIAYHTPIAQRVAHKRKKILAIMLLSLLIFSIFLVFSIRHWLYKPLKQLVDASSAVANGTANIELATNRNDEFGKLAMFIQDMLATLVDKHNQLQQTVIEVSQANQAKSAFLANMSHELRTPLNAIIGYSELIIEESRENNQTEHVSDLDKIKRSATHLLSLINDVLDLSKIEAGKMDIQLNIVEMRSFLDELMATIEPLAAKRGNMLTLHSKTNRKYLEIDNLKLKQVLINLLGNACKFTEHGKITLQVSEQIGRESTKQLCFTVKDSGIGIRPETLAVLFQPFTQEEQNYVRHYSGTGLGLSISKHLCELMGGNISVKSTPGIGSEFTVTLPIQNHSHSKGFIKSDNLPKASNQ